MPARKLKVGDRVKLANGDKFKVTKIEMVEQVHLKNDEKTAVRKNQFSPPSKGKKTWTWVSKPRGRPKKEDNSSE